MIGTQIGRYEVTELLGEGGMGKVFRAHDPKTGEAAAVKVLLPKFSKVESIVRRFFNEAKAAGSTHHPGIVDVYESGFSDDQAYIALELIDGEPLTDLIHRKSRLSSADVLALGTQISLALAAAHKNGIVHRDLKPDNIMLIDDSEAPRGRRVKILDFGLAKLLDDLGQATVRTNTGITMGTPSYMAPEQWRASRDIDHRADIYGLGCVLFHLVCGRPPFVYEGFADKMRAHLTEPAPDPRTLAKGVDDALATLLLTLLEKKPGNRYQTMVEVASALSAIERGEDIPAAPTRAQTADLRAPAKSASSAAGSEQSVHPSMPPAPSLAPIKASKLPLLLVGLLATVIVAGLIAWRLLG